MIEAAVEYAVQTLRAAPAPADRSGHPPRRRPAGTDQPLAAGPLHELVTAMDRGELTALDLAEQAVDRARGWSGVCTDLEEVAPGALRYAAQLDRAHDRADGSLTGGALAGIPVMVKDNIDVAGLVSGQGGSLGRHRATADSAVWSRLRAAGSVLIGHTAMHELAWGLTTPGCPNPWGAGLTPGGSSGGAASSVAAGIVPVSIGTDTGGSVRVPAALCGVVGLRPTHGMLSLAGIAALAPSLDTAGVLATTSADCVLVHELLSGPGDPAPERLAGQRVGVLAGWPDRVSVDVAAAMADAAAALRAREVEIVEVAVPAARLAPSIVYVLMLIESARAWLAEAERTPEQVGGIVLAHLRAGGRIDRDPALYPLAVALAAELAAHTIDALETNRLAALLAPVTATTGVPADSPTVLVNGRKTATADALSRYSALASVTGLPALSVPARLCDDGPIGVQLIGAPYAERTLAALAGPIEQGPGLAVAARRAGLTPF